MIYHARWPCLSAHPPITQCFFVITFAYAEAHKEEFEDVHSTFNKLLTTLQARLERRPAAYPPSPLPKGRRLHRRFREWHHGWHAAHVHVLVLSFGHSGKLETTGLTKRGAEYGLAYIVRSIHTSPDSTYVLYQIVVNHATNRRMRRVREPEFINPNRFSTVHLQRTW